jgi:hypothetical protein
MPAGVVAYAGIGAWIEQPTDAGGAIAVTALLLCSAAAIRWIFFSGAERIGDTLVVHALFGSRRIPLRQIQRITSGYAYIRWASGKGHRRITLLTPFWSDPNPLEFVTRYNDETLSLIHS